MQQTLADLAARGSEAGAQVADAVAAATPPVEELGAIAAETGARIADAASVGGAGVAEMGAKTTSVGEQMLAAMGGIQTSLAELGTKAEATGAQIVEAMQKAAESTKRAGEQAQESGFDFAKLGENALSMASAIVGTQLAFDAFDKIGEGIHSIIEEAGNAQVAETELNTVIQSTGNKAGVSAQSLEDYATHLSETTAFTKDSIIHAQSLLLTFTQIGGKQIPQATTALLNLTQMMGGDSQKAAVMLGKALNDPVKGVTALTRVGVSLSAQQQKQIKDYEKNGNAAAAQKIILDELNKEFGKQAEAYGKTLPGQMAIFQNKLSNTAEDIGKKLLPKAQDLANKVLPALETILDKLPDAAQRAGDFLGSAGDKIGATLGFMGDRIQNVTNFCEKFQGPIKVTAALLTGVFLPAIIKTGVESAVAGAKMAATLVRQVVESGVQSVVAGAKMAQTFIANVIKAGIEGWTSAGKLAAFIGSLIKSGVEAAVAGARMAATWIANVAKAGVEAVITAGKNLASLVPSLIATTADFVVMAATGIASAVTSFLAYIPVAFTAAAATLAAVWPFALIVAAVLAVIGVIVLLITHWDQVKAVLGAVAGKIGQFKDMVVGFIGELWSKVVAFFQSLGPKILALIQGAVNLWLDIYVRFPISVLEKFAELLAKLIAWALDMKAQIQQKILEAVTFWLTGFLTLKDKLVTAGGQIIQGLLTGLQNAEQLVINFITGLGQKILSSIKGLFGIASPSKVMAEIGGNMGEGLVQGFTSSDVQGQITTHLQGLTPAVTASVNGLTTGDALSAAVVAGRMSGPGSTVIINDLTINVDAPETSGDETAEEAGQTFGTNVGTAMATVLKQYGYSMQ